nr:transposase [Candidatus Enterovibrio escacola]
MLRHQVFKDTVKREKGMMGWFYGFKLHFIINHHGGILSVKVTTANVDG